MSRSNISKDELYIETSGKAPYGVVHWGPYILLLCYVCAVCGKVGSYHGEGARLYSACRLHKSASTSSRTSLKTDTRRTRRRTAPVNSTTATQRTRRGSHRRPPTVCYYVSKNDSLMAKDRTMVWLRGTKVERWSLTSELSLSCARPAADG